ncbi:hypothetical protein ACE38V_12795 [Cytobacillus sp. Hz8]|uniref:hypothetical protein n=1 Tax=Cytobacillus sp. Hz8 TaxID=3347168 RepID=UPI0035E09F7B
MINNIQIGSGNVSPELKEKLLEKYPYANGEKEALRVVGSIDGNLGERLVRLANEYFEIK